MSETQPPWTNEELFEQLAMMLGMTSAELLTKINDRSLTRLVLQRERPPFDWPLLQQAFELLGYHFVPPDAEMLKDTSADFQRMMWAAFFVDYQLCQARCPWESGETPCDRTRPFRCPRALLHRAKHNS
jgi:hypothetical protein